MKIEFHKYFWKALKKIRRNMESAPGESAGPIFGYYDIDKNYQPIIVITHLFDKTSDSSTISSEFVFTKTPWLIKRCNKQHDFQTRYIGTWHTHPHMPTNPSKIDIKTFKKICNQLEITYNIFLIFNETMCYSIIYKKGEKINHENKKF